MSFEDLVNSLGVSPDLVALLRDGFVGVIEPEGEEVYQGSSSRVFSGKRGVYVVFEKFVLWIPHLTGLELNSIVYYLRNSKDERETFLDLAVEYVAIKKTGLLGFRP